MIIPRKKENNKLKIDWNPIYNFNVAGTKYKKEIIEGTKPVAQVAL